MFESNLFFSIFVENLMIKTIYKPVTSVLKWGTVIVATAVVVISIQVNADGHRHNQDSSSALSEANPIAIDNKQNWSPATGFADLIEQVSPAVVHVSISGTVKSRQRIPEFNFPPGSPFEDFFEQFRNRQQPNQNESKKRPLGIGSGFIISEDGYVVTNHHVIAKADEIIITLTTGDEYEAELKGSDNKTDLALLKLKNAKDLPFVKFGDDDASRVGDWVVAIGNPFGLGGSASTGIISARGRDIRSGPYDDYIQVDAAINRGNSGGPLFNLQGEVIGINTAIYSPNGGSVGIGFSIPSNLAKNVISQLKESGEVERAWIGVQIQPLDDELAESFGRENDKGALVASVVSGKPADKAGIQAGDIILSFDGQEIEEMRDLPRVVAQSDVGKKSKVVVWRNGAKKTLTIVTDRFPDDDSIAGLSSGGSSESDDEAVKENAFGASLASLNSDLRSRFNISEDVDGVLIVDVAVDGLAAKNNLRKGDVLTSVNNKKVSSPKDVIDQLENAQDKGKQNIPVLLQRNNNSQFIPFNLED